MRLDKYLKVSRLIKRRTMAKEVCDRGRVQINGRPAKSGSSIEVEDELKIRYGTKLVTVKVERVIDTTRKDEAATMYTLLSEERLDQETDKTDLEDPW